MSSVMEIKVQQPQNGFERLAPAYEQGLSTQQVQQRAAAGAINTQQQGLTPSVGKIVRKNTLTLFNLINLGLAIAVILVGHPRNALFLGIAISNTLLGIFQELRAKKTLDKLSVLSRSKTCVMRNGEQQEISPEEIVLDDIIVVRAGGQIPADGIVVFAQGLEMNESMLTGEADVIQKHEGDEIYSGSFVVAGIACMRVEAVGENSYANYLTAQAKQQKDKQTPLMKTLNAIIKVLAFAILPIGGLLFYMQYSKGLDIASAVLGSSAAMIGMIPEGLVLLTGVTLTVGALKLAKRKALVQTLPSIETLARVDVLCLDKTGTITDGSLTFENIVPTAQQTQQEIGEIIGRFMGAVSDDNSTANALRKQFTQESSERAAFVVPFSSQRKYSGVYFENDGSYILGAPAFVLGSGAEKYKDIIEEFAKKGQRVLCLAHSQYALVDENLPQQLSCLSLIVLGDNIRPEAAETFSFFANEGVELKVISGDDALTVSTIAEKAGIANSHKYVDMSQINESVDLKQLVEDYTVFGRVLPAQKRELILALRANGHTCCMTGDGVNDVLAMKEASCSVSMINGSEAARGASDFVLMTNDFSAMTHVLREGRRVINNIENVACLYLVKTIYSFLLSLLYMFIPYPYPFEPLQMTPINSLAVGVPSFFLALRGNYKRPEGKFVLNILENSLPAALTVVISIVFIQLASISFNLSFVETSTMNALVTGTTCFVLLLKVSTPLNMWEKILIGTLCVAFVGCFIILGWFFGYAGLFSRNIFFYLPLLFVSPRLQTLMSNVVLKAEDFMKGRE